MNIEEVLLPKRESLMRELKQLDSIISQIQDEYSKKLEQLQEQKRPFQEALRHVEALLKLEGWSMAANPDANATNNTGATSAIDAAFSLLEELHQPMHYKEIVEKLHERRIYIAGKDPAATLLSKMSRDTRFKRTKRGTYALSSWRIRTTKTKHRKTIKPENR